MHAPRRALSPPRPCWPSRWPAPAAEPSASGAGVAPTSNPAAPTAAPKATAAPSATLAPTPTAAPFHRGSPARGRAGRAAAWPVRHCEPAQRRAATARNQLSQDVLHGAIGLVGKHDPGREDRCGGRTGHAVPVRLAVQPRVQGPVHRPHARRARRGNGCSRAPTGHRRPAGHQAGRISDVTIGGHPGTFVDYTVTTDTATCGDGQGGFWIWGSCPPPVTTGCEDTPGGDLRWGASKGNHERAYAIDVDGTTYTFFTAQPGRCRPRIARISSGSWTRSSSNPPADLPARRAGQPRPGARHWFGLPTNPPPPRRTRCCPSASS